MKHLVHISLALHEGNIKPGQIRLNVMNLDRGSQFKSDILRRRASGCAPIRTDPILPIARAQPTQRVVDLMKVPAANLPADDDDEEEDDAS